MTAYIIEKNVPMPQSKSRNLWPFYVMQIGDSFLVPAEKYLAAQTAAHTYAKDHNMKFAARKQRIWRIA